MNRSYSADVCPACGIHIPNRKELPFCSKKIWREQVADRLGYNRAFIVSLGLKTRIHRHHFSEDDIENDKPTGENL